MANAKGSAKGEANCKRISKTVLKKAGRVKGRLHTRQLEYKRRVRLDFVVV